jgi:hypothetical protein
MAAIRGFGKRGKWELSAPVLTEALPHRAGDAVLLIRQKAAEVAQEMR